VFKRLTPVGLVELLGGIDNVVAVVLRSELEGFSIILFNQFLEILTNNSLVNEELILSNIRYFE